MSARRSVSGRVDERVMQRIVAAAALKVAMAYGIGADAVASACGGQDGGFVAEAVAAHCAPEDRSPPRQG